MDLKPKSSVTNTYDPYNTVDVTTPPGMFTPDQLTSPVFIGTPTPINTVEDIKDLGITKASELSGEVKVVGNGDLFKLLSKASSKSQQWMKSSKAMEIPEVGCVVQVTTQNKDNVAEALVFVPGVRITEDTNGGRKLIKI